MKPKVLLRMVLLAAFIGLVCSAAQAASLFAVSGESYVDWGAYHQLEDSSWEGPYTYNNVPVEDGLMDYTWSSLVPETPPWLVSSGVSGLLAEPRTTLNIAGFAEIADDPGVCIGMSDTSLVFNLDTDSAVWITGEYANTTYGYFTNWDTAELYATWIGTDSISMSLFLPAGNYYIGITTDSGEQSAAWQGSYDITLTTVPEPVSMIMLGALGGGMALARRFRRRSA